MVGKSYPELDDHISDNSSLKHEKISFAKNIMFISKLSARENFLSISCF
jgi:hypothetical protein